MSSHTVEEGKGKQNRFILFLFFRNLSKLNLMKIRTNFKRTLPILVDERRKIHNIHIMAPLSFKSY